MVCWERTADRKPVTAPRAMSLLEDNVRAERISQPIQLLRIMLTVLALLALLAPAAVAEEPKPVFSGGLVRSDVKVTPSEPDFLSDRSLSALPTSVDLSEGLPPVGYQGNQGSCAGWALGYYAKSHMEYQERLWDTSTVDHQFSPSYVYNLRTTDNCGADQGMSLYEGLQILSNGAATMVDFPYDALDPCTQPSQQLVCDSYDYRIASFGNVFIGEGMVSIETLKTYLANGQPFVIAVPIYSSLRLITASDPVVPVPQAGETYYGGHALYVIGYDDAMGGFQVVNSWGPFWGDNGYGYLSYEFVSQYAWEAWYAVDHVENATYLQPGWQALSLPCLPENSGIDEVLERIYGQVTRVMTWDTQTQTWQVYSASLPPYANEPFSVGPADGLWVEMASAGTAPICEEYSGQSVALSQGWNLVSPPVAQEMAIEATSAGSDLAIQLIASYCPAGEGLWETYAPAVPQAATLESVAPGNAYWVYCTQATVWTS